MRIHTLESAPEAAAAAADVLVRAAAADPELVLGLPTGRTMVPFYAELARRHRAGDADLSRARGFNLDELLLPPDHPASFRAFMERHAWGRTGLDPGRAEIPDPAADPAAECARYDRALAAAGPLDLVVLGVGADGHVAYNLPGPVHEETHVVEMPPEVAATLRPPVAPPLRAITMGFAPLRTARRLLLLAATADKRRAVEALLDGPLDPAWPCSLLRGHPSFDLFLTPDAGGGRPRREDAERETAGAALRR
jgi:glucosamine-6-phosphate deaminase